MMEAVVDRFDTSDRADLVGVYDVLIGNPTCLEDSGAAVDAYQAAEWLSLLSITTWPISDGRES